MRFASLGALAGLLLLPLAAMAAGPLRPLLVCYEDVDQRPWSTPGGKGLNFELLHRVESQLGEQFTFTAKPWRRCLEELRIGHIDAVIAAADSSERRGYAVFPTLPDGKGDPARALYEDEVNVFLRVGGSASWDGEEIRSVDRAVGVQAGYLVGDILRSRGYQIRDPVKSTADALRMLVNGSLDVAVLQGGEASALVREDQRFKGKIRQAAPPYMLVSLYLMVGRTAYERAPQRFDAIWSAIGEVRKSRDYRSQELAAGVMRP